MAMTTQTADYIDAATHLPAGARLVLHDVAWDDYEQVLYELGDRARLRISYDNGRLDIMSPSARHESIKNLLHDLVVIICEEQAGAFLSLGSVTLKREQFGKGIEADDCFYLQDVEAVIGKDRLNLSSDPPPDLAIEGDLTHESARKLSLYAALGVTEVWQYSDNGIVFSHLDESRAYRAAPNSLVFPFLTSEKIAEFISGAESSRSYEARRDFRVWVRSNQPKSC
jgi:Uma2 family endonuclease